MTKRKREAEAPKMGADYYQILEVGEDATEADLKRSFKRLVKKWHPDKNPANKEEAESMFKRVCEAYEVLSNPRRRAVFDKNDENAQVPPADAGASHGGVGASHGGAGASHGGAGASHGGAGASHGGASSNGGGGAAFCSTGGFPASSCFGRRSGFEEFVRCTASEGVRSTFSWGEGFRPSWVPRKAAPVMYKLPCTLEELYKGNTRRMKIPRVIVEASGKHRTEEEILAIDVKAGWEKGTKITFTGKGNREPNVKPADVVFIVVEKVHRVYTRVGNDLVVTKTISLLEALTGYTVNLVTLDGRNLTVPINEIIHPGYVKVLQGEGMPFVDETKKGNLKIKFEVIFPAKLTFDQKVGIKKLLGP